MLLPFSAIPSVVEVSEPKVVTKKSTRSKPVDVHSVSSSSQESDCDQSKSDSCVPRYIITRRRNKSFDRKRVKSVPDSSLGLHDTSVPGL